jgi:hypothetical protein
MASKYRVPTSSFRANSIAISFSTTRPYVATKIETRNTPHKRKSFVLVRRFLKKSIWPVIDIHAERAIEGHSFTKNIGMLSEGHFAPQHRVDLDHKKAVPVTYSPTDLAFTVIMDERRMTAMRVGIGRSKHIT